MHYCEYEDHISYVSLVLNKSVSEIEKEGWIHVYKGSEVIRPNNDKRMTHAQARVIREELNLKVFDSDIQYQ